MFHVYFHGLLSFVVWEVFALHSFLEFVTDSETTHRDQYTDCLPMLWSPVNFVAPQAPWLYASEVHTVIYPYVLCICTYISLELYNNRVMFAGMRV